MFDYSDPTGTGILDETGAILIYRLLLDRQYRRFAEVPDSAFTLLEAFDGLDEESGLGSATVAWAAFPRNVAQRLGATFDEIDRDRFRLQEEYVEWRVERDGDDRVERVTFTTLFPEWFQSLAAFGMDQLARGLRSFHPEAEPTPEELFGPGFDPDRATAFERFVRFQAALRDNPWNNGERGILVLTQPVNTLGALANLVGACGIERPEVGPGSVCELVSGAGACVPGRNSDPNVCLAAQNLVRDARAFSLADPAGIAILRIGGIWKLDGEQVDLNDPEDNEELWRIDHGGRRAVLEVPPELTFVDDPVDSGARVATVVQVGSSVVHAPEEAIPDWAQTGFETVRRLPE